MHEHAGTAAAEGEQKKRREELSGGGARRVKRVPSRSSAIERECTSLSLSAPVRRSS
jgi:hypothetical protein